MFVQNLKGFPIDSSVECSEADGEQLSLYLQNASWRELFEERAKLKKINDVLMFEFKSKNSSNPLLHYTEPVRPIGKIEQMFGSEKR